MTEKPDSLAVRMQTARQWLEVQTAEIAKVLPREMPVEHFKRVVATAFLKKPEILEDRASLILAIMECAGLGLEPDDALGQAYLAPRKGKCVLMLGYKSYIQLAYRPPTAVLSIGAEAVYEKDDFEPPNLADLRPLRRHIPAAGMRGEVVAAYAWAQLKGGGRAFRWLWREEIEAHRAKSQMGQHPEGMWVNFYAAAARKTAIRVLSPYIPQNRLFARALAVDEAEPLIVTPETMVVPEKPDAQAALAAALEEKGE